MNNGIFLLGATGSVGKSALKAISQINARLVGFTFHKNLTQAREILKTFHPKYVIATDLESYEKLKADAGKTQVLFGLNAILDKIADDSTTTVVNALTGLIGLLPSIESLQNGKKLVIANKESIVCGSKILLSQKQYENQIIPIDSEHWSIFTLFENVRKEKVKEILITASGGAFKDYPVERMKEITPEQALAHPVWDMGNMITVSSSTMANKGLEVLEAKELFGFPMEQIKVCVHPEAKIHGMLKFKDGSLIAHISRTSMVEPARNALLYPDLIDGDDFKITGNVFHFEEADTRKFPMLRLAYEAGEKGHVYQIVYTMANEMAVEAFLNHRIHFNDMALGVEKTLECFTNQSISSVDEVLRIDEEARARAAGILEKLKK